jgi:hypothetical protein
MKKRANCYYLENLDPLFIDIFKNIPRDKLYAILPPSSYYYCYYLNNDEGIILKSELLKAIDEFCKYCYKTKILYENKFKFVAQAGSGAIVLKTSGAYSGGSTSKTNKFAIKIYNLYPYDVDFFDDCSTDYDRFIGNKIVFVKELWANSYINRMIPKEISKNFVKYYKNKSYICSDKPNINNDFFDTPSKLYGYITMYLLDGSLYDYVKSGGKLNYGHIFEIVYAKYIAKKYCNLVFTDHMHLGNYGYKISPKTRNYKIGNVDIRISNREYVKLIDLADFVMPNDTDNNFFWNRKDIFPDTYLEEDITFNNYVDENEKLNVYTLIENLRRSYDRNSQIQDFEEIIKVSAPKNYN